MNRGLDIKAFESDLKAVDRKYNLRLFVLLGIMLPLSFFYDRSPLKTGFLDATLIIILAGGILSLVIGIAKAKGGVALRHGLVCPHCHSVPKAFFALRVMRSGICPKCKQKMITRPSALPNPHSPPAQGADGADVGRENMNDYYVPSQQELIDAIRAEMAFLMTTYGFQEVTDRSEKHINPYSVLYRKNNIAILVEGVSYGFGMNCEFRIEEDSKRIQPERINLGYIVMLRAPQLLEPKYPEKRGQLTQLPKLAEHLRLVALDLLHGDLSNLDEIKDFIRKRQQKAEGENHRKEVSTIDMKSQEAFHLGNYGKVVDMLLPIEADLSVSGRKRLEMARKKLGK